MIIVDATCLKMASCVTVSRSKTTFSFKKEEKKQKENREREKLSFNYKLIRLIKQRVSSYPSRAKLSAKGNIKRNGTGFGSFDHNAALIEGK